MSQAESSLYKTKPQWRRHVCSATWWLLWLLLQVCWWIVHIELHVHYEYSYVTCSRYTKQHIQHITILICIITAVRTCSYTARSSVYNQVASQLEALETQQWTQRDNPVALHVFHLSCLLWAMLCNDVQLFVCSSSIVDPRAEHEGLVTAALNPHVQLVANAMNS